MTGASSRYTAAYYAENYRGYERQNPSWKLRFYANLLMRHAPSGGAVLDLGCAFGRFLAHLDRKWQIYGIDLSGYAIGIATASMPRARLAVASADAIPFRGPFDAIVAFDVVEHVHNLDTLAACVTGALARNGTFIFVVPVYDGPLGPLVRRLDKDPTHVHQRSRDFWLAWASRHFRIVEWTGVFRYLLPLGIYVNWPSAACRRIAPAIAVCAKSRG